MCEHPDKKTDPCLVLLCRLSHCDISWHCIVMSFMSLCSSYDRTRATDPN